MVSSMWIWAALCLVISWLIKVLFSWIGFVNSLAHIPGPPALPLLGNILQVPADQADFFKYIAECSKKYGGIFKLWIGFRPFIFIQQAELVQPILSSRNHIDKSFEYSLLKPWIGEGLLTSTGEKWNFHRKLLTPTFHNTILEKYLGIMWDEAENLKNKLFAYVGKGEINLVPITKLFSLDVICGTTMGVSINAQKNSQSPYVLSTEVLSRILTYRFVTPWLKEDFIFNLTSYGRVQKKHLKVVNNFTSQVVKERKQEMLAQNDVLRNQGKKKATMTLLLEMAQQGENITEPDIQDEVSTIVLAGHDTTATTIAFALFLLGGNKDEQNRVLEELNQVCPDLCKDGLSIQQLSQLTYLENCIKETMRIFPIVPIIARQINSPLTTDAGLILPGCTVLINSDMLHKDPRFFSDPNKFIPDRFNSDKRHPFSFIPFSAGPRNCIGQKLAMIEMKIALAVLLKTYEFSTKLRPDQLILASEIVVSSRNGVPVSITKRNC